MNWFVWWLTRSGSRTDASAHSIFDLASAKPQPRERQSAAPPTTSHVLTPVVQNGLSIRSVLRQEEDRDRCRPLQGWQGPHQGQRKASFPRPARDPALQGLRARPNPRPRQVRRRRHPRPRHRRRSHLADLRHPPGHRQVHCRILPEVRRRALQEPAQAGPRPVRPHTPRRRQQAVRAQEVRRSWRPRPLPEVLPLSAREGAWRGTTTAGVLFEFDSSSIRVRFDFDSTLDPQSGREKRNGGPFLSACVRPYLRITGPGCEKACVDTRHDKTNTSNAKHAADDGQHVCKYTHFTASTGAC